MVGVQRTLSQVGASLHNAIMIHTRWTPIRLGGCMALGVGSALGILFKGHFVLSTRLRYISNYSFESVSDETVSVVKSSHVGAGIACGIPEEVVTWLVGDH